MSRIRNARSKSNMIFLSIIFLMLVILIDTSLIKFYDLFDKQGIPMIKKISFGLMAVATLIVQFVVIHRIRNTSGNQKSATKIKVEQMYRITKLSLFFLMIIFSLLIFEIFYLNYYHTVLLIIIILVSYGTGSILIIKNLQLFVSWLRLKRGIVFGLYTLSMSMITFNLVMTALLVSASLAERPTETRHFVGGTMDISGGKYLFISDLFRISAVLSFISIWITTVSLMRTSRDQIIGKVLYWIILILPLVYFIISYFADKILSGLLIPYLRSDPIWISVMFTLIFVLSKPIGGVIFGVLFWRISRLVSFEKGLRDYMVISGYGFLLLFSANQSSSLVLAPYPPFGIITITVLILATYFVLIGIYRSAIMASGNAELRKSIFKIAGESQLLDLIGRTEMEKRVRNTVTKIVKQTSDSSSDTSDFELDEEELKGYVDKVIEHLNKK